MIVFVVLGRLGKGLSESKVKPILNSDRVAKVYVFADKEHFTHRKMKYILVPHIFSERNLLLKLLRFIFEPLQLIYYAIRLKPNIINGVFTIPKGYNSFIASRLCRAKNIISILGNTNEIAAWIKYTRIVKKIHLWFYRKTEVVTTKGVAISEYLHEHGINKNKVFVFNGAIDTKRFAYEKTKRDIDVLFVGKFSELKGPDRVLKVVHKLKETIPEVNLTYLGVGPLTAQIRQMSAELSLNENVVFEGQVSNTQEFFNRARVLLMPSRSEGLSTAMLEAMACGCVPIVSDVGSMTDAAYHNENSLVVSNYLDIDSFYKFTKLLLTDETERNRLSSNAMKLVHENYTVNAQTVVFDKIIDYMKF